jgi:hypothetical protein
MQSLAGLRNIEAVDRQMAAETLDQARRPADRSGGKYPAGSGRSDRRRRAKIASVVNLKRENPIRIYQ